MMNKYERMKNYTKLLKRNTSNGLDVVLPLFKSVVPFPFRAFINYFLLLKRCVLTVGRVGRLSDGKNITTNLGIVPV